MSVCTFFGHRDCPDCLRPRLREAVEELIREAGVDIFYVGNQGQFDAMVLSVLREMGQVYPQIRYGVVLAYLPQGETVPEAMFPEGLERVPPRYAISRRNDWMLHRADFVVTYVTHTWGGAAGYEKREEKLGKHLIPLAKV